MPNKGRVLLTKMATPWDVCRNTRRVANLLLSGQISAAKASALNGLLNTTLKCIEQAGLEERITELELKLLKKKGRV